MKLSKQELRALQELKHFKKLLGKKQTKWLTPQELDDIIKVQVKEVNPRQTPHKVNPRQTNFKLLVKKIKKKFDFLNLKCYN